MAEISKYNRGAVGRLFQHNNRKQGDGVTHSNKEIDDARTNENYHFKEGGIDLYRKRMKEVYHMNREDLVTLAEVIVTLPQDVKTEDEKKFFRTVYDFYCRDFGEQNIINAVVHKDETTPHIHIDFCPAVPIDREKISSEQARRIAGFEQTHGAVTEQLNCKELLNRSYFQNMHPRLYDYVAEHLGYTCEIINGATANGNKTVLELKNERMERSIEQKKNLSLSLQKNINSVVKQLDHLSLDKSYFDSTELVNKLYLAEQENIMLKECIAAHHIPVPSQNVKEIMELTEELKSNFTYHKDTIKPEGLLVVETFLEDERILPLRRLIESDEELERIIEEERPEEIMVTDKYIIFPTDCIEDTLENLLQLKRREKEFKKITFPQISNDTFSIAEQILKQCTFETEYYVAANRSRENLFREQNLIRLIEE